MEDLSRKTITYFLWLGKINLYKWKFWSDATWNKKRRIVEFVLTVSVVLSNLSPSRYHVITAGGLEPALWHNKSYLRPADRGWWAPNNLIFRGATEIFSIKIVKMSFKM